MKSNVFSSSGCLQWHFSKIFKELFDVKYGTHMLNEKDSN